MVYCIIYALCAIVISTTSGNLGIMSFNISLGHVSMKYDATAFIAVQWRMSTKVNP